MSEPKADYHAGQPETIQFYASLPPIQAALKISGDGDNLRAQFDIPIRITPDGLKLTLFTQKRLLVTVQELPDSLINKQDHNATQRRKQQSGWTPA